MSMIERAAKALAQAQSGVDVYDALDEGMQETLKENARAVLEAVREPSEGMARAMLANVPEGSDPGAFGAAWYGMIDAALAEQ